MVALVHLLRVAYGWVVNVAGGDIPMWASVVGLVIAGVLAAGLWWESRR